MFLSLLRLLYHKNSIVLYVNKIIFKKLLDNEGKETPEEMFEIMKFGYKNKN